MRPVPGRPSTQLLLYRTSRNAWEAGVAPWLRESAESLTRSYVVVATRGQAQGLKQRCLADNLPLVGVEFLTPGLARKKWLSQIRSTLQPKAAVGREILLLGLETLVENRLRPLRTTDPAWGFWKSFQSDLERALDDFDDLLKAGFTPGDFPIAPMAGLFQDLAAWVENLGYDLAPVQGERAGLTPVAADAAPIGQRLLVYGLSAELWSEFFNVAAFARRFRQVTVVLPIPEFRGKSQLDERWVELWQALLGVEAEPLDERELGASCDSVGQLLSGARETAAPPEIAKRSSVLIGPSRFDEMAQVADEIVRLLETGADNIGVVFPSADTAHLLLCGMLERRKIQFTSALDLASPVGPEASVQRALLRFYLNGARLDDVLELWPLLVGIGFSEVKLVEMRLACERLFEEFQAHPLGLYLERIADSEKPALRELTRLASIVLPAFPERITIAAATRRFAAVCENLGVGAPTELSALMSLGERDITEHSSVVLLHALQSFLRDGQASRVAGVAAFARVTLTTRRRADGLFFSHLFLVEANAGVWPRQAESSPWLTDDAKAALNARSKYSLGLYTADDRAALERQSLARLTRDTGTQVIFSAALYDEADPELRLGPNGWLERILWTDPALRSARCSMDELFTRLSQKSPERRGEEGAGEHDPAVQAWKSRRDPHVPFDRHFCSADPSLVPPLPLAARVLERGVRDPAELWFAAVLEAKRVDWQPFTRARKRSLGQWVHKVLAAGLGPAESNGVFGPRVEPEVARERIRLELDALRRRWPEDLYWKSYHLELSRAVELIFEAVQTISSAGFAAAELTLPAAAEISLGRGYRLRIKGRIDYVVADREDWREAKVEIVDFKTGADLGVSAKRIAKEGRGLQLALYLAAAQSLGAKDGRVWMAKPTVPPLSSLGMESLSEALSGLEEVEWHLRTGVYGSLTPPRSEYEPEGFRWPLACVPVPFDVLLAKNALFLERVTQEERA